MNYAHFMSIEGRMRGSWNVDKIKWGKRIFVSVPYVQNTTAIFCLERGIQGIKWLLLETYNCYVTDPETRPTLHVGMLVAKDDNHSALKRSYCWYDSLEIPIIPKMFLVLRPLLCLQLLSHASLSMRRRQLTRLDLLISPLEELHILRRRRGNLPSVSC